MNTLIIISFFLIIVALLVERYFYTKEMTGRLTQAMEAVMSRNMNDYLAAKTADKKVDERASEPEEVDIDEASDKEFMQHIQSQTQ